MAFIFPLTHTHTLAHRHTPSSSLYFLFPFSLQVTANDTLTSIAARFDTTPSELTKLNKLSTRFVYPGQVIAVPDKATATLDKPGGPHDTHDYTGVSHGECDSTGFAGKLLSAKGEDRIPALSVFFFSESHHYM